MINPDDTRLHRTERGSHSLGQAHELIEPETGYRIRLQRSEQRDIAVQAGSQSAAVQQLLESGLDSAWEKAGEIRLTRLQIVSDRA